MFNVRSSLGILRVAISPIANLSLVDRQMAQDTTVDAASIYV
jgi:hypothetical protein